MSPWTYTGYLMMPLLVISGYWLGGWWNFITPALCFIIHPLLNLLAKERHSHEEEQHDKYPAFVYRLIAFLYVPVVIVLTVWALYNSSAIDRLSFIGLALSVGIINGVIGFTLAHEFIHRHSKTEQAAGYLLLLCNCYMHYGIEHIRGHHVYACTSKDPHTARTGESFYRFFPRAIKQTFLNAWEIEQKQKQRGNKTLLRRQNRMTIFLLLQFLLITAITILAGWKALLFFLLQAFIAVFLLHIINYLQHYGLVRKQVKSDQFERMAAHHSWSSGNRLTSLNLFQLDNHADHHINPAHSYETLKPLQESPQHPTGYSGMIILALIPPLWFRIIHKKIVFNH
ncbi:MAG: alkane 1-monooxygenase [Ferruginibacter sp.]